MPNKKGSRPEQAMGDSPQPVTSNTKKMLNESVHRQESLRVSRRFEPAHLPFALSSRLMRNFRPVVLVSLGAVHKRRHYRTVGSRVTA
jgi:hypothetical protein